MTGCCINSLAWTWNIIAKGSERNGTFDFTDGT